MSNMLDFYLERADENARSARETNLINVRDRYLRAESVWRSMADRLIRMDEQKKRDASAKTAGLEQSQSLPWPIAPIRNGSKPRS